ncbi:unnamed protein product [Orchesella dallaii]|uniref:Peptidase S1 domain-containing protein n=1 Tax=Orchesella dallaii TaxID=48710 RepID=A0ABP1PPY4_9HEXA
MTGRFLAITLMNRKLIDPGDDICTLTISQTGRGRGKRRLFNSLLAYFNLNRILREKCVTNLPYGYQLKVVRLEEYDQRTTQDCEKVESGSKVCAPPVQDMEIDKIIPHEDYDKRKSRENDIVLIRLKKHAALGQFVSPVSIPHGEKLQKVNSKEGNRLIVAGWGRLAYDSPDSAPVPDSEGPLMMPLRPKSLGGPIRIFQLGVVSLGPSRCCHAGQPALYSKISEFMTCDFIFTSDNYVTL